MDKMDLTAEEALTRSDLYPINIEDTGSSGSCYPETAAPAPQRLPASSFNGGVNGRAFMAMYQFDTTEACLFGIDEAIILHNIRFWIAKNTANKKHFHDGRFWTYNSASAFTELFPFWNQKKISRVLHSLESSGAIITGNFNKVSYDRTKWYTIDEQSISNKREIHFPNLSNGSSRNVQPIPDINTDSKPDINTDTSLSPDGDAVQIQTDEIATHYNTVRGAMPECMKVTDRRRSQIKARIEEVGVEELKRIITECKDMPHLQGENDRGWKADLEWITNAANFTKIREGRYRKEKKPVFRGF